MNSFLQRLIRNRHGSTIVLALAFGIVLLIIVGGLRKFSSHRIQSSIREWNVLKAQSLAEAGLAMTMAELSQQFSYQTHAVDGDLKWGAAKGMQQVDFNGNGGVQLTGGENFSGQIPGMDGTFEARCGLIPYADDPSTENIDETRAYILVESIGNFKNTYRKIRAVLNRRFPGKECLMYDGDVLSVVYGDPSSSGKTNTFSKGNLYGHYGVEISQILRTNFGGGTSGTKQKFDSVPRIMSGKGGVFFLSGTSLNNITINPSPDWDNKDFSGLEYAGGPSKNHCGQYPKEFLDAAPPLQPEAAEFLRDKNNPVVMTPAFLPTEYYKKLAGNTVTTSPTESHPAYTGGSANMICLDFGDAIRPPISGLPTGEVIYCEEDVVIRGNPPNDITIVSKKNIYVDGDFNQGSNRSGDQGNNTTGTEKYGFPQDYAGNPLDYETTNYNLPTDKYKIARIIAGERLIFDYRDIKKIFGNEAFPYLKYKVAERIMNDETKAFDAFLKSDGTEKIEKIETASYTYIETTVSTDTGIISQETDPANPDSLKPDAIEKAKVAILGMVGTYTKTDLQLEPEWAAIETDLKTKIPDPTSWSETSEMLPGYPQTDSDGNTVEKKKFTKSAEVKFLVDCCRTDDVMKAVFKEKIWDKLAAAGASKLFEELKAKASSNNSPGDYLFFPEYTTNGMFNSFGTRSEDETFYPGADFSKHFDEAGDVVPAVSFIHRLLGTEAHFRTTKVAGQGQSYNPPVRKKIYDKNVVDKWGPDDSKILDVPTFGLMVWKESAASGFDF